MMAVAKVPQSSRLTMKVQTGVSASGSPVYRQRSFNNLKPAASDSDVYAVGQALAGLQIHTLASVTRVDDATLENQ